MKRNFWAIVVFAVLVTIFFHFFGVPESFAGAWDSRDPEVVRAEGIVDGINQYTLPAMERIRGRAVEWLSARMNKPNAEAFRKRTEFVYQKRFGPVKALLVALVASPDKGKTLLPSDPRLVKLFTAIESANRSVFVLLEEVRRVEACEDGRAKGTIAKPCF